MNSLNSLQTTCPHDLRADSQDTKLFINDYNLESDWDNNMKLKSLIEWIKRWEADGVTKIDGIGTQMHISCYVDHGDRFLNEFVEFTSNNLSP